MCFLGLINDWLYVCQSVTAGHQESPVGLLRLREVKDVQREREGREGEREGGRGGCNNPLSLNCTSHWVKTITLVCGVYRVAAP